MERRDEKQGRMTSRMRRGTAGVVPVLLMLAALTVAPASAEPGPDTDVMLAQLQRNLDLAGVLMETDNPIEAAKLATAWQAATLGVSLESVPAPRHEAPSVAVLALTERHGVTPSAQQMEQVMELDVLPAAQRDALTGVVDAFLALEDATRIAYADADLDGLLVLVETGPEAVGGGVTSLVDAGVQVGLILGTRNDFLDAVVAFQEAFGSVSSTTSAEPGVDLCPAVALDLDGLDTTYEDECSLTLDVGGNDVYLNNAGGSGPSEQPGTPCHTNLGMISVAAAADLYGDDQYVSETNCGTNGGGYYGVGFLLDQAGSDTYAADSFGTNGGSHLGIGFLLDQSGNDNYDAWYVGTNGGSVEGIGFLLDQTGNDTYTAGYIGTNGGGNNGIGFLLDQSGDDFYHAGTIFGSTATNGEASNGAGLLLDAAGTDGYQIGSGPVAMDQTIVPKGTVGAQVDIKMPPPPNPKIRDNGDGACTVHDDQDNDGTVDSGEELATAPCPDLKARDNGDGTFTLYDDHDHDSHADPGEEIVTTVVDHDAGCEPTMPGLGDTVTCWAWVTVDGQYVINEQQEVPIPTQPVVDYDAGCEPLVPGFGDILLCWAWVTIDGEYVINEEQDVQVPAQPVVDHDAGCIPTVPSPGDEVTCWAWVSVDGERVIDEEQSVSAPAQPAVEHDAGCSPTVPSFDDTVTCWAWVTVDGEYVINEQEEVPIPAQPVIDHDAGCNPVPPGFGDTVTCWAWVEVDGERVIDEEHSEQLPANTVDEDGDGVPDDLEPWVCQVQNVNFGFDGDCNDDLTDYTPPTQDDVVQGILDFVEQILESPSDTPSAFL